MRKHLHTLIKQIVVLTTTMVVCSTFFSQGFYNRSAWKKHRHEVSFNLGVSNFLGDLGGRDMIGRDFIWDLEISKTKFAAGFNYQYYLGRKTTLKTSLFYGRVAGDDALTQESFRNNRNLNFESDIIELGLNMEIHLIKEKIGNIYNLKSSTGKKLGQRSFNMGVYLTFGIAGFYYNPIGTGSGGQKFPLRPLRTEGQGLPGGPEAYGKFNIALPLGIGFRKSLNRTIGVKMELAHRFTFTDYIDDVSTVYYSPSILASEVGGNSVYFANPQLGNKPNITTAPGQQRGDPTDRDGYMFLTAGLYIRIESKSKFYGRNKVRKLRTSF